MPYQFADYGRALSNAAGIQGQRIRNRLGQAKLQGLQAAREQQSRLGGLTQKYLSGEKEALPQIAAIDTDKAQKLQNMTAQEKEQARQEAMDFAKPFVAALRSPNPEQAYQQAYQMAAQKYPDKLQKLGMPQQFDPNAVIPRLGAVVKTIKDLSLDQGDQYGRSLTEAVDAEGNRVFVQPSGQGGVRQVEGYRPAPNRKTVTDQFGKTYIINLDDNTVQPVGAEAPEGDVEVGQPQVEQPQSDQPTNLFNEVERGTGPKAQLQELTSNVIGPFVEGSMFPETERAKTAIRTFNQEAKTALVNNPRFPVAEQELVQRLLPDTEKFFTDPDAQRDRLQQLRQHLLRKKQLNEQTLASGQITEKEVGAISNQNAAIDRIVGMMGDPEQQGSNIQSMSIEELQQLDRSQLSDDELKQAADRWDELQGGQ